MTGEMNGLMVKSIAAFIEDVGSVPSTHMVVQTVYNPRLRRLDACSWPLQALGMHLVYEHSCRKTLILIKLRKLIIF